jgi:hypothetical protein
MGATNYALRINTPVPIGSKTTTSTAAVTALSLGGAVRIWVKGTEDTRIRFGDSSVAAPTSGDALLTADVDYVFDVIPGHTYARVRRDGGTDTTVRFMRVG